jgi:hypothetical protein
MYKYIRGTGVAQAEYETDWKCGKAIGFHVGAVDIRKWHSPSRMGCWLSRHEGGCGAMNQQNCGVLTRRFNLHVCFRAR